MAYGIIYKITNVLDDMAYVGQTVNLKRRIYQHRTGDQFVDKAIQRDGWENFALDIVAVCNSKEELNEKEVFYIAYFNCKFPNGYNLTDGGEGLPGESNPFYGRHHTEETKAILREKNRNNKNFLGKHHTLENCLVLSEKHRGESPYKNLLIEMERLQLTYSALAERMGLTQPALSMKMRDMRFFTEKDAEKLVEIFNRPIEYLLQRDDGLPTILTSRAGEKNPFFGKHHTGENLTKFSKMNRGETPYKNLLKVMDELHLTYTSLAILLGISQANFSRKILGVRNFTAKDIDKLVEILGCPAEYLMARDDGVAVKTSNRGKTPFKNLAKELDKRKMTYTALGKLMGLSHQSISEKMHGKKRFTEAEWAKLSEILNCPVEYLMQRDE
ncbi:MAG: helix-turn-helix domain-containing protein [Selenomonadaceae bacterium]|nr:helix-turn-helix domain-containing protein [Selenomonadaceae bacterium]MBQ4404939.1 helix-turn-helix domain-containing protein [Selenomonadaceae bacterium]